MNDPDFTLYDMIVRNATLYPDREAVVCGVRRITFGAYRKLCDQYATGLRQEGTAAGDRIAVLAGNEADFLILCGAAARIGAIVVPVNWRLGEDEIAYILNDTTPRHLFNSREYGETAKKAAARTGSIQRRYTFRADEADGDCLPFDTLCREEETDRVTAPLNLSGDTPFMIIHTAAVSGKPRGCVLSQANLAVAGLQIAQLLRIDSRDSYVGLLPLFHIGGLAMTLSVMHQGGKNVLVERFDPPSVLRLIEKEAGSFFVTFPPMLTSLLDAQEQGIISTASLRVACGVDGPDTIERFLKTNPRAVFYSLYGQTEAMPVSGGDYREKPGSIGRPAIMTRVALCDDHDGEVPPGTPGEICVRSPAVFRGYWNLEEETKYTFRNGWHHTGDLGRLDDEGFLWYAGRKPEKELIKPGGENVYPAEVEKAILSHAAIAEACVIGVPDPDWGEAVKAVCVLKKGHTVSATELIAFVAAGIARYKKPKHVVFIEELPKTAAGAIDREAVKKAYA
jgi:acyl-CoA synthetase (AMP-forming)/AMP-acid ligase II